MEGIFLQQEDDVEHEDFKNKKVEADWVKKWVDENSLIRVRRMWSNADVEAERYTYSPVENEWVKNGFGGMPTLFQNHAPTPIAISAMETEISLEEKVNKLIQEELLKKLKEGGEPNTKGKTAGLQYHRNFYQMFLFAVFETAIGKRGCFKGGAGVVGEGVRVFGYTYKIAFNFAVVIHILKQGHGVGAVFKVGNVGR